MLTSWQVAAIGWAMAQGIKCVIQFIQERRVSLRSIVGSGGMPSSHSATVCSLATHMAFKYGLSSPYFSISAVLAAVTMYDAMGVRRETGEQGKTLNEMLDLFEKQGWMLHSTREFKELVGHTPLQVLCGAILGILVGCTCTALV